MGKIERCPTCGSAAIPIMYGSPVPAAVDASNDGKLVLGGCFLAGPSWQCATDPAHRWGDVEADWDDRRHIAAVNKIVKQYR